ncbi:MAG: hypothetical protein WBQ23_08735 [Bacteroidota bacterium]
MRIRQVRFSVAQQSGLSLDLSTPGLRSLDTTLNRGDTLRVWYRLHVAPSTRARYELLDWNMDAGSSAWAFGSDHWLDIPAVKSVTDVAESPVPMDVELQTPMPHPVLGSAVISIMLNSERHVCLELLDLLGRRVSLVHDGLLPSGASSLHLSRGDLPSGMYLLRLSSPSQLLRQRRILLR